ncbi:MAG: YidB family protein [Caulobacteraceae bacterium]|jgi:uncharacterized protein YidB (DUF937 family)
MGLFDTLKSLAGGALGGQDPAQFAEGELSSDQGQQMLQGALGNSSLGGIGGVLGALQSSGLGGAVASWVPGGDHQPITGEELQAALGDEHVQSLAQQFGVDPSQATSMLAQFLPGLAAAHQGGGDSDS